MNTVPKKQMALNINGKLTVIDRPWVMGILNVTPDSFYVGSRSEEDTMIIARLQKMMNEGADIIDIGAYSSRPQAENISSKEEMRRLDKGLSIIRRFYPEAIVSVDTFRADVARWCVEEYSVAIINDISAGELDEKMFSTVALLGVPYIMMHMRGTPQTMMSHTAYNNLIAEILRYFAQKIDRLTLMGAKDLIIDPGFGFSKTLKNNYLLMNRLADFNVFGLPLLVGVSRKSMIYKLLETTPEESLNGTVVLNTLALLSGADILRVHDVREAVETVKIVSETLRSE